MKVLEEEHTDNSSNDIWFSEYKNTGKSLMYSLKIVIYFPDVSWAINYYILMKKFNYKNNEKLDTHTKKEEMWGSSSNIFVGFCKQKG